MREANIDNHMLLVNIKQYNSEMSTIGDKPAECLDFRTSAVQSNTCLISCDVRKLHQKFQVHAATRYARGPHQD